MASKPFGKTAQRSKPLGKKTIRKMVRDQPTMVRGYRADLAGKYRT